MRVELRHFGYGAEIFNGLLGSDDGELTDTGFKAESGEQ